MSPRFNTHRIRKQHSYSIQEVCDLLVVHKNTVREWFRHGLPKTDKQKPCLIYGGDLKVFLDARQKSRRKKCEVDEFYCLKCRTQKRSFGNIVDLKIRNSKTVMASGLCEDCETPLNKVQSVKDLKKVFQAFDIPKQQQEHIYDSLTHSLNCHLRKDDKL